MNAVFSQTKCGKSFDQSQKLLLGVYNLAAISLEFGKHAVLHALCSCLFALKTAYALFAFANMRTQLHEMLKDLRFLEQLEWILLLSKSRHQKRLGRSSQGRSSICNFWIEVL
ncbi:hypothetical protein PF002_g16659 [Phytophthora fragariae]|uniref:Uncharacterized protein n=1 Tax=Phytophthora fragariae TaxID=53985 RepID=A0A6A3YII5_9STRA|nr:hypothetical protein PF004_g14479 [Phytophthora fragariae]KAE9217900.1 hypothetical protein PF002_g16659 [Phytophthora fragariae]